MVCLGPMSNPDPTSIINLETDRIPLKVSNMTSDWSLAFRSWPSVTPGKSAMSYEFCYSSVVARQVGFVQMPPLPFFADKVQARNPIGNALTYNRLKSLEPVIDMTQLADCQITPLTTIPFAQWWSEW